MHIKMHYTPTTTNPTAFHNPSLHTTNKHEAYLCKWRHQGHVPPLGKRLPFSAPPLVTGESLTPSLVPTPLSEKSRRGLASAIQQFVPRGLYSARQSDCRVQLYHVNRFVTDLCTSWCCESCDHV